MGIEEALVAYLPEGMENSRGYDWLKDFTYGALHEYGVGFYGSYSPATNQRAITIRSIVRTDEQKAYAAALLDAIAVYIKPHVAEKPTRRDQEVVGTKVFSVTSDEYGVTTAHQMPDGTWGLGVTSYGTFRMHSRFKTARELIDAVQASPEEDEDRY